MAKTKQLNFKAMVLVTTNHRSLSLLLGIAGWFQHTTIEREGFKWIAKTHADWADEVGLSKVQVRKAFRDLKTAGLIHTKQFIWGGKTIGHTRLSKAATLAVYVQPGSTT